MKTNNIDLYKTILTFPDGSMMVRTSLLVDLVECALKQVREKNPSSNMFFFFERSDLSLELENKTYVVKVFPVYSSSSDEKMIGMRIFDELKDALALSLPNLRYRIVISGKKSLAK